MISFEKKCPELLKEWDYEKNIGLDPHKIGCGSNKKVWWKCSENHSWLATVNHRINMKSGCPFCAGKKVLKGFNDLESNFPDIAKEWDYEKNFPLKPSEITSKSNRKFWWICGNKHSFECAVSDRTRSDRRKVMCPVCSGHSVNVGVNDLKTVCKNLVSEWDYEKNNGLIPEMFTKFSHRKVWWKCSKCGNSWIAEISNRTNMLSGCPKCAKSTQVSFPEKILAFYLKRVLPIRENISIDKWNVDILIGNVVIEYDGEYFHSLNRNKDEIKNKDLESKGYAVIRILGKKKSDYVKLSNTRYEIQESNYEHFKQLMLDLYKYLEVNCSPDVDVKRDYDLIRKMVK